MMCDDLVFRLYTSDQAQYLFQTSDEKELLTWIDSINAVVARYRDHPNMMSQSNDIFLTFSSLVKVPI